MAKNIVSSGFLGTSFKYQDETDSQNVNLMIPATYNIYNAVMAIRAAKELGVSPKQSKCALENIRHLDGRFRILHANPTVVIDYAHTSFASDSLLKNLYSIKNTGQKLCVVFGCGGERDVAKRSVMGKCAEKYADKIIVTSDNPRDEQPMKIINDITRDMEKKPIVIVNREEAIHYAIENVDDGEIIAIVGKGPEKYSIENGIYKTFDEERIVISALAKRKSNHNT